MITIFALVSLILSNVTLFFKNLALKSKIEKQKHDIEMFMKLHKEAETKLRDEANKNIILQSLINQRQKA